MREIRLYGELGRRFGRIHRLAVSTTAEAVRALCCTIEGFEDFLRQEGAEFRVWAGLSRVCDQDGLHSPSSDRDTIRIAPVISGAKSQIGRIIVGVVLVVASFFVPQLAAFAGANLAATTAATIASTLFYVGTSLVVGGVAQLLAGNPNQKAGDGDKQKQSYVFNGAVNATAQGATVPVGYGRLRVGSVVISASIKTQDVSTV